MSDAVQRGIPVAITFLLGMFITFAYFTDNAIVGNVSTEIMNIAVVLASYALGIGAINLFMIHAKKIRKKSEGWWNSVVLLVILLVVTSYGMIYSITNPIYNFFFLNFYSPLTTAVFGFLGFYVASSAFRAFRVRTIDSTLLFVCATLVMLKNAPIGTTIWGGFDPIGRWISEVIQVAGMRGILIGVALGGIAMGLRVLLGYERGYLRSKE